MNKPPSLLRYVVETPSSRCHRRLLRPMPLNPFPSLCTTSRHIKIESRRQKEPLSGYCTASSNTFAVGPLVMVQSNHEFPTRGRDRKADTARQDVIKRLPSEYQSKRQPKAEPEKNERRRRTAMEPNQMVLDAWTPLRVPKCLLKYHPEMDPEPIPRQCEGGGPRVPWPTPRQPSRSFRSLLADYSTRVA